MVDFNLNAQARCAGDAPSGAGPRRRADPVTGNDTVVAGCLHLISSDRENRCAPPLTSTLDINVLIQAKGFRDQNRIENSLNASSAGLNSAAGNYSAAADANFQGQALASWIANNHSSGDIMFSQLMQKAASQAPRVASSLGQVDGLPGRFIKRAMVDVNSYLGEVTAKISETSRSHEYEQDSMAVEFLVNACIDPRGCIDVIATLHSGSYKPIAAFGDSHPGEVERIKNFQDAI